MKKIVALVLALVLTLTAVAALAASSPEDPSSKTGGTTGKPTYNYNVVVVEEKETLLIPIDDTSDSVTGKIKSSVKTANDNNKLVETLSENVTLWKDYTQVNEMVTTRFPEGSIYKIFKIKVQAPYTKNTKVQVLIAIPQDDGTTVWLSVTGTVNANNEIVFKLSNADYKKVAGKEVVIIPVNKPAEAK